MYNKNDNLIKNEYEDVKTNKRETLRYMLVGVLTSAVNLGFFYGLLYFAKMNYLWSNIIAWGCTVIVAYFANKLWVFKTPFVWNKKTGIEFVRFVYSRVFSFIVDMLLMWFLVDKMRFYAELVKIINSAVVVLLNYILAKAMVFKPKKGDKKK